MIYYFNPDTEMALKAGDASFYIAPAPVRQMAHDLALLPLWIADAEDVILVDEMPTSDFVAQIHTLFPQMTLPAILTPQQLPSAMPITPWGWNPTLFAKLKRWGLNQPEQEAAAPLRYALGNKANLHLLDHELLRRGLSSAQQRHFAIHSVTQAEELLLREPRLFSQGFLLKEGYSSSGRGHRWCRPAERTTTTPQQLLHSDLRQWIIRRTRGGKAIDMEPLYNKVADLALLFHISSTGQVRFNGYSLFETTPEGAYRSNHLASNESILSYIDSLIDISLIEEAKQTYQCLFEERYARLSGPIGVDMMIYRNPDSGSLLLHPDVEINPRPTMGLVARRLYDLLLAPQDTWWRFVIEGSASSSQLQQHHTNDQQQHPLLHDNQGRLTSGYLPLTPIGPHTRFRAYMKR